MKKMQCKIPTTEEIICPFLLYIFINYLIYLVLKNADLLKKRGGGVFLLVGTMPLVKEPTFSI